MDATELSSQLGQIRQVLQDMGKRLHAIEEALDNVDQVVPVLNGTRSDLVALRGEIRRLSAQQEVALSQLATDEEPSRVAQDVRDVLRARRNSRQRLNMILVTVLGARHMQEELPDLSDELHAFAAADAQTLAALGRIVSSAHDKAA